MDFDGDGIFDLISGSYDPGDIYLAKGRGKGRYDAFQPILDAAGVPLAHHPAELAQYNARDPKADAMSDDMLRLRVASFGSWPSVVDWDGDGDLDVLIGSFNGGIFLRTNVGTRKAPSFSPEAIAVCADGNAVQVNGHACPVAKDWDGDGRFDLVIGSSDGAVVWHRNIGPADAPQFGPPRPLVPAKSSSKGLLRHVAPGAVPSPGARAQIAVEDYDGDGRMDLLLGDYTDVVRLRELTSEEQASFDRIVKDRDSLGAAIAKASDGSPEQMALIEKLDALEATMKPYFEGSGKSVRTSFVWLFRRLGGS